MSELHQKLYATLFGRVETVMDYISSEMILKNAYDYDHTRETLLRLQSALQECEDIYVNAGQ